jgi:hypothetical protein
VRNPFTSSCELHRSAEDDEIYHVNDEEVEEEQLESEQNQRDALDAVGWFVGVVMSLETRKRVAGKFAVKYH